MEQQRVNLRGRLPSTELQGITEYWMYGQITDYWTSRPFLVRNLKTLLSTELMREFLSAELAGQYRVFNLMVQFTEY